MDIIQVNSSNKLVMESPYCHTAFSQYYRSSSTSLASHESGGSGTRRKQFEEKVFSSRKGRRISHCQSIPKSLGLEGRNRHQAMARRKYSAAVLRPRAPNGVKRHSLPILTQNEGWNDSDMKRTLPKNLFDLRPKSALKKGASLSRRSKRSVTFAEPPPSKGRDADEGGGPSSCDRDWYTTSDCDQFLEDSLARAESVRRLMSYASMNEYTYNSSIGLPSPRALEDYLSFPQEVIGIEHLLAGQGDSRSSLKRSHARMLTEYEASRRGREGGTRDDPILLAERLGNNSRILSNMARERAAYVASLD